MSILIKGIDLPKEGEDITLEINHEGEVRAYSTELKETDIEAQAKQIDRPHGRLIDADLFKELIKDSVPSWTIGVKIPTYGDMDIMGKIGCMPTILEAEE